MCVVSETVEDKCDSYCGVWGYDIVIGLGLGENHSLSFHHPENTESHYFGVFKVPPHNLVLHTELK
jgi:hypothetical protein